MNIETKKKILDDYCSYMSDGHTVDYDSSNEAKTIYKNFKTYNNGITPKGETLTSCQNFVNRTCGLLVPKNLYSDNTFFSKSVMISLNNEGVLFKYLEKQNSIFELISCYHTPGNILPIPEYFNGERAGFFADWDNWNTTLYFIKKFYDYNVIKDINCETINKNSDKMLIDLFDRSIYKNYNYYVIYPTKTISVFNLKKWLCCFSNFNEFIDEYKLNDYIESGRVVELYDGQFYDNGKDKEYQREKINLNGLVGRNDFVTIPQNCDIEKLNSIIDKVVSIINNRNERLRHS